MNFHDLRLDSCSFAPLAERHTEKKKSVIGWEPMKKAII